MRTLRPQLLFHLGRYPITRRLASECFHGETHDFAKLFWITADFGDGRTHCVGHNFVTRLRRQILLKNQRLAALFLGELRAMPFVKFAGRLFSPFSYPSEFFL